MGADPPAADETLQSSWEWTLATGHDPAATISPGLEITRRTVKTSLADGIRRLGYEFGAEFPRPPSNHQPVQLALASWVRTRLIKLTRFLIR